MRNLLFMGLHILKMFAVPPKEGIVITILVSSFGKAWRVSACYVYQNVQCGHIFECIWRQRLAVWLPIAQEGGFGVYY